MKLSVNSLKATAVDVGVDLCGRDVRVPEHLVNLSQIGTAGQQVSCETVAQGVGAYL